MKKLLCFFCLALILPALALAQVTEEWVARYDGPASGYDYACALAVDDAGNIYVTGMSEGSGHRDYATIKYSSEGDQQWVVRYDGPTSGSDEAHAIAVDGSGNVYVTGMSEGSRHRDYATIKYSSEGDQQWVVRYDGPASGSDQARAIAVDGSGNVYVTGVSEGLEGTGYDYATIKYNTDGEEQWVARYDGLRSGDDWTSGIAIDDTGNVYVTGLSPGLGTDLDYATVKYNSSGVQQWVARYDGPASYRDEAYAIALDEAGNVYVTGESHGSGSGEDYATVKYDPSGVEQWVARYDGGGPGIRDDDAQAIALDGAGNVYVTGLSYGSGTSEDYATVKYDVSGIEQWVTRYDGPGSGDDDANAITIDDSGYVYVTGVSYGSGHYDYATIKYSSAGAEQWVARYDGPASGSDRANAIAIDDADNVYVTGTSTGSGTGDDYDYATIKYSQGPGVKEAPVFSQIQVSTTLNRLTYDAETSAQLTLYSADGRKVLEETVEGKGVWIPSSLPSGVYFARIHSGEAYHTAKMVVVR